MSPLRSTETVLLIEDNHEARTVIGRILCDGGYRVLPAASAGEALACARGAESIDVILSDVILPDVPGPEVARQIQVDHPGAKTLFMSGHTTHALLRDGTLRAGANFIQKPFGGRAFLATLKEVLGV